MRKTLTLALLPLCLGALSASAQHYYDNELHTGPYVGVRSALTIAGDIKISAPGISGASIGLKNGYDITGVVGYRKMLDEIHSFKFLETRKPWALRFEAEGGYGTNDFEGINDGSGNWLDGSMKNYRLMGNVMLDIPLSDMFYISIGGGLGWIHSKLSASSSIGSGSGSDNAFAYQGGFVLGAQLNDYWNLELSYRAFSYSDISLGGANFESPVINMLGVGVTYQF